VASLNSFAGWQMMFCDSADEKGNCVGKSETFILSRNSVSLKAVLSNTEGLRTAKIYFEVYLIDQASFSEDLISTEELKTESTAFSANKTITLTKRGSYLIKTRDSYKDYITSRELAVK